MRRQKSSRPARSASLDDEGDAWSDVVMADGGSGSEETESAPKPQWYDVKRGDTLQGIALRTGLTVSRLKELNKSISGRVFQGQRLFLQEGIDPSTMEFRRFILRFYNKHNSSKMSEVDGILSRWQGREQLC